MSDFEAILSHLQNHLEGDVLHSYNHRSAYATDESIFSLLPSLIVCPKTETDLKIVLEVAIHHGISVTCRGGGTGVAGQSIGSGIVIDFKRYLNRILDITQDRALVQPGVLLKDINHELGILGRRFAPDPGSWMSCTIGGMVGTNASGPRGYKYGSTREHILGLKVMLADGSEHHGEQLEARFADLTRSIKSEEARIRAHWPEVRKNSSGYPLLELCHLSPRYDRFLVGSEGTLALTTEILVQTIPAPKQTTLAIYGFDRLCDAIEFVSKARACGPAAIELLDHYILRALERANSGILRAMDLEGTMASIWVEWDDDPPTFPSEKSFIVKDAAGLSNLRSMRSKASKYLHEQARKHQPLRCVEDTVVPIEHAEVYLERLKELLSRHECPGAIFGHVGDGHFHMNPQIDVTQPRLWGRIERLMEDVYDLTLSMGGSISGEHGDGILRTKHARKQWNSLMDLFFKAKSAFDPTGVLNPGKKISHEVFIHPPLRGWN